MSWRAITRCKCGVWGRWSTRNTCPACRRQRDARYRPVRRVRQAIYILVLRAVRSGRLVRSSCVRCGAVDVEAHHEDYSRVVDVVWLCRRCHAALHRGGWSLDGLSLKR